MVLPLGLVALNWIRMFKPLIEGGLPQLPGEKMAFVTESFRALRPIAANDLRPGSSFAEHGDALRRALAAAAHVITDMPARHLTFADDKPIFQTKYGRMPRPLASFMVEEEALWEYGTTRVPLNVWNALRRMSAWIEPMLVAEWIRLTRFYAERAGRTVTADEIMAALRWTEPGRDTRFVRELAASRMARGLPVNCVWSGRRLHAEQMDIDHCLPWSAWQCGDLWNLLPAAQAVNRHGKRDSIVTAGALADAKAAITAWWHDAYMEGDPALKLRFGQEARATLPVRRAGEPDLDDLFAALDFRRLRLRQDTQLREWSGLRTS